MAGNSRNALGDTVVLTFSEAMTTATLSNVTGITSITGSIGSAYTLNNDTGAWSDGDTVYTVTLDEATDGVYIRNTETVTVILAGTVLDLAGNPVSTTGIASGAVGKESTVPTIAVTAASVTAAGDTVTITSNEVLVAATTTLTNWTVQYDDNGAGLNIQTLSLANAAAVIDATKKIVTITLDEITDGSAIPSSKFIKVSASAAITDLVGNTGVVADYTDTGVTSESTAPTVTTPSPADAATNVAIDTTITVTMSEALNQATVNNNTVKLYVDAGTADQVDIGTDTEVASTVTLENNGSSTKIYINPVANLSNSGNYIYRISTSVKDLAGNALAANADYDFTTVASTADVTPPTISSTTPTHASAQTGVAITVAPTITFSEAIAPATVTATTVYISTSATDNTGIVTANVAMANGNTSVTITPASSLAYSTAYYLHATTAVTDANGNAIAAQFNGTNSFTTIASGAPVITAVAPSAITTTTATIAWTTDVTSTANIVEYGLTSGLGSTNTTDVGTTSHSAALTSLTADRTYYYRVKSTAGGSTTSSDILTFTTSADTTNIAMDSITMIKSYATADSTYANGWKWAVSISVWDTAETSFKLKLTDFASGSNTIAISGNVRVGLTNEASAATDAVIEAATQAIGNAYTDQATALTLVDSNPSKGGIQDTVYIYVQVPTGSAGGSYTSSYGIQTN